MKITSLLYSLIPLKNIILLESRPVYTDNTKAVFDEMIKQGLNSKYKFYWFYYPEDKYLPDISIKNVYLINSHPSSYIEKIRNFYLRRSAKCMLAANRNLAFKKFRNDQIYIYLNHGTAIKTTKDSMIVGEYADKVLMLSDMLEEYDCINMKTKHKQSLVLGFPRNDILTNTRIDLHKYFKQNYKKLIYWLPTYRQNDGDGAKHSSISMPIIHDKKRALEVNQIANENNVLIVVKPHYAQDMSYVKELNLSNLIFINDSFFNENNISSYEFLASTDALISDYSSVYYDYLLVDKPIGICHEDIDEYKTSEGLIDIYDDIIQGGEIINTDKDMFKFIKNVSLNKDNLKAKRNTIKNSIHKDTTNNSSVKVVDYILELLNK